MTTVANASGNGSDCPSPLQFSLHVEFPVYLLQLNMAAVGFVLNGLTLFVFLSGKEFKGAPFVFMTALALCDMCNLVLKSPECFIMAYRRAPQSAAVRKVKFYLYMRLVEYLSPLGNVTENISVWLIVCLALERYVSMKHYGIAKTKCTPCNAGLVTCGCGLGAVCANLFSFFAARARLVSSGNETFVMARGTEFYGTAWYAGLSWARAFSAQFLPLLFLSAANIRLILVLHRQSRRMQKYSSASGAGAQRRWGEESTTSVSQAFATPVKRSSISSRRQLAQRRLTVMLIVVICVVLFGQVPQAFSHHSLFTRIFASCARCRQLDSCLLYRKYKMLANIPTVLCYSCNFAIYFALNKHFRCRALLIVTCGRRRRLGRRLSGNNNNNGDGYGYCSTAAGTERRASNVDEEPADIALSPLLHGGDGEAASAEEAPKTVARSRRRLSSGIDFIDVDISDSQTRVGQQVTFR